MLSASLRSLPYLVHTNRELGLMLRAEKPLARFSCVRDAEPECVLRYLRMFDRHVAAGRFLKQVETLPISAPKSPHRFIDTISYALPGEGWRFAGMTALLAEPGGWSEEKERRFGALLGYTEEQNDIWIESCDFSPRP